MASADSLDTDVLVVGGGGAGARAAIAADDSHSRAILATKHFLGRSGCTPQLAYMSVVGPWKSDGDSVELALKDLIESGGGLGDVELTRIIVEESAARLADLESYGARFDKKDGVAILGQLAGHSKPRTITFASRKLGSSMMQALSREIGRRKITTLEHVTLTKLLTKNRAIAGAVLFDYQRGEILVVKCPSVVIATGGYGAIYSPTTVTKEDTGDGLALALEAGAELLDMENVPFLPGNNRAWGSQKSWGETPHFLNTKGERFMLKYNPEGAEFGTKEIIVQSIAKEVKEGRGTKRGGVYSDLTYLPWNMPSVQTDMSDLLDHGKRFGYDPKKVPVEMWPVAHTPTGGILVDSSGETSVPGLYAAGAAAYGMYGFGRIEGFTSIITQVFGKRAGEAAAVRAKKATRSEPDVSEVQSERARILAIPDQREGRFPAKLMKEIHTVMYEHAWILRDEEDLGTGLEKILTLREEKIALSSSSKTFNGEWLEALEVPNLLLMAELLLRASIMRKESRGSFSRTDYPKKDDSNWRTNIMFKKEGNVIKSFLRKSQG